MSRPDTCAAQPETYQGDRGDIYRGRTRGPVYSDRRSGVSKQPRRHLSARRSTRSSDDPRQDRTSEATPTGGRRCTRSSDDPRQDRTSEATPTGGRRCTRSSDNPGRIGHQRRHLPVERSTSWRLPQDWEDGMPLRPDEQQATGDTYQRRPCLSL